jgi:hypothetical protein
MGEGGEEGRRARAKARDMMAVCRRAIGDGGSSALMLKRLCNEIIGRVGLRSHSGSPLRLVIFLLKWSVI